MWIKSSQLFCLLYLSVTYSAPSIDLPATATATATGGGGSCQCGKANNYNRIFGGDTTEKNEFPWMVGLTLRNGSKPFCGGSIVSSKTVVTAAHCLMHFRVDEIRVVVAEHDINTSDGEKYVRVCGKAEHPNYDNHVNYDVGILTLCEDLIYSDVVAPICLPTTLGIGSQYENRDTVVTGWGFTELRIRSNKLQKVTIKTMTNEKCQKTGNQIVGISESMICASNPGKDTCLNDSGGPMMINENGTYTLVGIVSWGIGCAIPNHPGVYARVTQAICWIYANIQGYRCDISV